MKSAPDTSQRQGDRKQTPSAPTFQLSCDETVYILKNTYLEILMLENRMERRIVSQQKTERDSFILLRQKDGVKTNKLTAVTCLPLG